VTPEISKFIIKPAVINCKKRIAAAQPVTTAWGIYNKLVKIIHQYGIKNKCNAISNIYTVISKYRLRVNGCHARQ
jgi:hypothetical protein